MGREKVDEWVGSGGVGPSELVYTLSDWEKTIRTDGKVTAGRRVYGFYKVMPETEARIVEKMG